MRISYNLAHWLCLIGGIALILTGFTAKMMLSGSSSMTTSTSGQAQSRSNEISQRALLILLGIGVVVYSLTRLLY